MNGLARGPMGVPVVNLDSDAGFRALVELSPDAVFVIADGYHVFANTRALALLGASRIEELQVKPAHEFMHPDYQSQSIGRLDELLYQRNPLGYVEEKIVRLDGAVLDIEAAGTPIELDGSPAALVVVRDITARKRQEAAVRSAEQRLHAAFRQAPTAMLIANRHGSVLAANPALGRLVGRIHTDLLSLPCFDLVSDEDREHVEDRWDRLVADDAEIIDGEFRYRRADGDTGWVYACAASLGDDHAYVVHLTDVTAATLARQHLAQRASLDSLTGLPNRSVILDRLHARSDTHRDMALLFLDLDGFKQINDAYGHQIGDSVLTVIAERLRASVPESDIVGRLGGDEFAVIVNGPGSDVRATAVADRIRASVGEPIEVAGLSLRVGVSIGIAHATPESLPAQLLSNADAAMYRAKAILRQQRNPDH